MELGVLDRYCLIFHVRSNVRGLCRRRWLKLVATPAEASQKFQAEDRRDGRPHSTGGMPIWLLERHVLVSRLEDLSDLNFELRSLSFWFHGRFRAGPSRFLPLQV